MKNTLIVFAGLPGTGKTTLCKLIQKKVNCKFFDSDLYAKKKGFHKIFMGARNEKEQRKLREKFYGDKVNEIKRLLKTHKLVVFDAVFDREKLRKKFYSMVDKVNARLIIIKVIAPEKITLKRINADKKHFSRRPGEKPAGRILSYKIMKKDWEPIKRKHFIVDSTKNTDKQLTKILNQIIN
ncbi:MAG: AAA family ATPase [Candidatus Nanoarchaeia archaeon]